MKPATSEAGEAPTADELLDYRDGKLSDAERDRITAKLAAFPEAALALSNLERFPDVEPGPGVVEPSEAETDAAWERFRQRMGYPDTRSGEAPADSVKSSPEPAAPLPHHRSTWWARPVAGWLAAGLLLALGLVAGWQLGRLQPRPLANVAVAQLAPRGEVPDRDAGATAFVLPAEAEGVLLVLALAHDGGFAHFTVIVESAAGRRIASLDGLTPDAAGRLRLQLPAARLAAGEYRVEVRGAADRPPVATYELRVERPAGR